MKAIVTGAAGFIGSRLCHDLVNSGYEVLGVDAFRAHYSRELKSLRVAELLEPAGIKLCELDLINFEEFNELVGDFSPTTIFHLAAQPGVRVPISQSQNYIQDNLVVHGNVMKSAVLNGIPKVLYASSSSVYGDSSTPPFTETEKNLLPISLYGSTKLANEIISPNFVKNSDTRSRGLRFFTVYGPYGRPDMAYFRLIASALDGEEFELFGDGQVKRDFTFVDDISSMTIKLDQQLSDIPVGTSDLVNIGGGAPHSMIDLVASIENVLKLKVPIKYVGKNSNDTKFTLADTSLIQELTGTQPRTDLSVGIKQVINWAERPQIKQKMREWVESST
jgi:UDP-glucuronate 4-epimerase